jgi:hypothetical protein
MLSIVIVMKSPNKLHDSPVKKQSYLSPVNTVSPLKYQHDITSEQNQHSPFRTRSVALPSISPLEYGRRRIVASHSIFGKQQQNDAHLKISKSCKRRLVFVSELIISICVFLFLYLSLNGLYREESLDGFKTIQRYIHLEDKKEGIALSIVVSTVNDVEHLNTDGKRARKEGKIDGIVDESAPSRTAVDLKSTHTSKTRIENITEGPDFSASGLVRKGSVYSSPYSSYHKNKQQASKFAYAYVISGCNQEAAHRNYLYDISISTYIQREAGSTADVIVFIQMAFKSDLEALPEQDQMLMAAMDIHIHYIPKAEDESFYRTILDKFLVLGLTQYHRVLLMDGDVMTRGNLDYLFDLSMKGVLKKNIVTAGKSEPANAGFFMLTPSKGATERIMAVIYDKEKRGSNMPYPHWDEEIGWGHVFSENDYAEFLNGKKTNKWDFYGAFADQGKVKTDCILEHFIVSHTAIFSQKDCCTNG